MDRTGSATGRRRSRDWDTVGGGAGDRAPGVFARSQDARDCFDQCCDGAITDIVDGSRSGVLYDGKWVEFVSDRSGWPHIYVISADATSESQAKELSKGNFGAGYATWSPDGKKIAYAHSADGNQMERFISIVDPATGKTESIVAARGVNYDPIFSPDGTKLA